MTKQDVLNELISTAEKSEGGFKEGLLYAIGLIEDGLHYPAQLEVFNSGDDEKGAGGFWDLAGECALAIANYAAENQSEDMFLPPHHAEDWGQEKIYNILAAELTSLNKE